MRFTILRMLSSSSLSAFTAAVQARARSQIGGQTGPTEAMPVRAQAVSPPQDSGRGTPALSLRPPPQQTPPDNRLPRGSLLDLSV